MQFLMASAPEAARDFLLPLPGIPTACGNGKGEVSQDLRAAFWAQDEDHRPTGSRVPSFCSIGAILPSRPARSPCRCAQRRSRMARLRAASAARSVLDGREHDGMLDRVGAAISLCNKQTIKRRPRKTIKKRTHAHRLRRFQAFMPPPPWVPCPQTRWTIVMASFCRCLSTPIQ